MQKIDTTWSRILDHKCTSRLRRIESKQIINHILVPAGLTATVAAVISIGYILIKLPQMVYN